MTTPSHMLAFGARSQDGRAGTLWGSSSCIAAAEGTPFVDSHGAAFACAPAAWVASYQPLQRVRAGACGGERLQLCTVQPVPLSTMLLAVGGGLVGCLLLGLCVCCERRAHGLTRVRLEEKEMDAVLEVRSAAEPACIRPACTRPACTRPACTRPAY